MTDQQNLTDVWSALSRKVLASVLVDEGAVFPVLEIIQHNARWFAPKERPIWEGVIKCLDDDTIPTTEAVAVRANGKIDLGYIQAITAQFNDEDNRYLSYTAEQLKETGILMAVQRLGSDLSSTASTTEIEQVISRSTTELSGLLANRSERPAVAHMVSAAAWEEVEKFDGSATPTGIRWFDELTGGLWPGMNYLIPAAYKSGKTTLMRNCLLHAAKNDQPVIAFCAEGSREMFALGCQVMLAAGVLLDQGYKPEQLRLSAMLIKQNWRYRHSYFKPEEIKAMEAGRDIWDTLPVLVYDTRDGIRDLNTFNYILKRDKWTLWSSSKHCVRDRNRGLCRETA